MTKKHHKVFVFLVVLVAIRFFGATFINSTITNSMELLLACGVIFLSMPHILPTRSAFVLPIQLMVFSIGLSVVMAYISWGQGIKASLIVTLPLMLWVFFFYLLHLRFSVRSLEKIILYLGMAYVVLFFFQYLYPDRILFGKAIGGGDQWTINRGVLRIIFPGGGVFFLAVFIAITKLTQAKKRKWIWIAFTVFGIMVPILQVTRQFIAGIAIIYVIHFLKGQPLKHKLLAIAAFGIITLILSTSNHPAIKGLRQTQDQEMSGEGTSNVRLSAGEYFLTRFSPNTMSQVFGNGVPYGSFTSYGRHVSKLNQLGFYLEDVGLVAIYTMHGVFAVIAYFLIWIKSITLPLPRRYYYVKYYLWFLFITGFTSNSLYSPYYLITTVIALYIFQITVQEVTRKNHQINRMTRQIKHWQQSTHDRSRHHLQEHATQFT